MNSTPTLFPAPSLTSVLARLSLSPSSPTQKEDVFADVSEFVQSALDGYNVTLFSYGQTGSGKTHSMQGAGHEAMRGIIPRSIEQVLSSALFQLVGLHLESHRQPSRLPTVSPSALLLQTFTFSNLFFPMFLLFLPSFACTFPVGVVVQQKESKLTIVVCSPRWGRQR